MALITSANGRQAVSFKGDSRRSSMAVLLTDYSIDASWRLTIEAKTEDGGYFLLGSVDTVAVQNLRIKNQNRIVAIASVPGASQWNIYAHLLSGTPARNHTNVTAEMKLSAAEEFGGSCCPLIAVEGLAIPSTSTDGRQTPTGAPPTGSSILLFAGSGTARAADVAYLGAASAFVQIHDLGISAVGPTTASMIGIGYPVDIIVAQTILLNWPEGRKFANGFTVALSTTQNTFTPSAETISAFGRWDTP